MAAGDAQRVWFSEMIERFLPLAEGMTFDAVIDLRDDLDAMLQRIRSFDPSATSAPQSSGALIAGMLAKARTLTSVFAP